MPRKKTTRSCVYCSLRRIKCDGNLPCQACRVEERTCKPFGRRLSPSKKSPEVSKKSPSPPLCRTALHNSPLDTDDMKTLEFLRLTSVHNLPSGLFRNSLWNSEILAAAMDIPVLRYAVIAFGASGMYSRESYTSSSSMTYAQNLYGKAITELRREISKERNLSVDVSTTMLVCVLFSIIECRFRNWRSAYQHYEAALSIVQRLEDGDFIHSFSPGQLSETVRTETIVKLSSMGQQFTIVLPEARRLSKLPRVLTPQRIMLPDPTQPPKSLQVANVALQTSLVTFTSLMAQNWEDERQQFLTGLQCWDVELRRKDRARLYPYEAQNARLYEGHMLLLICATKALSGRGSRSAWEDLLPEFTRLFALVCLIIEKEAESCFPFSCATDFGVFKLLFFIITKCTAPEIRYAALEVVRGLHHTEGIWYGQDLYEYLAHVVAMEESELLIGERAEGYKTAYAYRQKGEGVGCT